MKRLAGLSWILAALAGGCSSTADTKAPTTDAVVCDGNEGVRLSAIVAGGGQATPGQAMLGENGWQFLLVDGGCTAWLQSDLGRVSHVALDRDGERELAARLKLGTWPATSPVGGRCFDASSITFRWDGHAFGGTPCGSAAGEPLSQLNAGYHAEMMALAPSAVPASGDVRYLVTTNADGLASGTPIAWPLDVAPESIALEGFSYERGKSRLATGETAARLREIRAAATSPAILTVSPSGGRFALYIRDVTPFEDDRGLLPLSTF